LFFSTGRTPQRDAGSDPFRSNSLTRSEIEQLSKLSDDAVDLGRGALLVARLEYPDLDPTGVLLRLDAMAGRIRESISPDARVADRLAAINHYLFEEQGFRGNREEFYDPRNSCLNAVLERRLGIPISLSVLYMEIGRRLGVEAEGVSFPGHFLVRISLEFGVIVLDPYNQGVTLSEEDVRERLAQQTGSEFAESADLVDILQPAGKKEIIARMVRNLKRIYSEAGATEKAIKAATLILAVQPNAHTELRDRGLLYRRIEAYRAALADLSNYLEKEPEAHDADALRGLVIELRGINDRFN
jgi:regulator of sirC expression with transglutaminase-like and TPR domain